MCKPISTQRRGILTTRYSYTLYVHFTCPLQGYLSLTVCREQAITYLYFGSVGRRDDLSKLQDYKAKTAKDQSLNEYFWGWDLSLRWPRHFYFCLRCKSFDHHFGSLKMHPFVVEYWIILLDIIVEIADQALYPARG